MGRDLTTSPLPEHTVWHRAGSAWTDRGNACLVSGRPGGRAAAVRCHRRAIELLSRLPIDENTEYLADLGAAWTNLGCALQAGSGDSTAAEAADAFGRAIGLLERLPIARSRFRHNLAAAWMNLAGALERTASREGGIRAYERAIAIARQLPLDGNPSFRILLAGCWINYGNLLPGTAGAARTAYDEALIALGPLPQSGHRLARHHAATACICLAESLLQSQPGEAAASAWGAFAHLAGPDLGGVASADLGLRALCARALALASLSRRRSAGARGAEQIGALTDAIEQGLEFAFGCRGLAPEKFDPWAAWFFAFGCRVYGRFQPQFLAEFVEEALRRPGSEAGPVRAVARIALARTLEDLSRSRMIVGGTPQAERLLHTVGEIRRASVRLG